VKRTGRVARLILALTLLAAAARGVPAQEPPSLGGTWVGTWWMGKYEEPIEMELVQSGTTLSGRVAMLGYPGADGDGGLTAPAVTLTGRLDGDRLVLVWLVGQRHFTAALTPAGPRTLVGLGGEGGRVVVGFELNRVR